MSHTEPTPTAYSRKVCAKTGFADESELFAAAAANHPSPLSTIDITLWSAINDHNRNEEKFAGAMQRSAEMAARAVEKLAEGDADLYHAEQATHYANEAAEYVREMKIADGKIQSLLSIREAVLKA